MLVAIRCGWLRLSSMRGWTVKRKIRNIREMTNPVALDVFFANIANITFGVFACFAARYCRSKLRKIVGDRMNFLPACGGCMGACFLGIRD